MFLLLVLLAAAVSGQPELTTAALGEGTEIHPSTGAPDILVTKAEGIHTNTISAEAHPPQSEGMSNHSQSGSNITGNTSNTTNKIDNLDKKYEIVTSTVVPARMENIVSMLTVVNTSPINDVIKESSTVAQTGNTFPFGDVKENLISQAADSNTVKTSLNSESTTKNLVKTEFMTVKTEFTTLTTQHTTEPSEIPTTSKPSTISNSRSTVKNYEPSSTSRAITTSQYNENVVRDTGISSTVEPVWNPIAYAGSSGSDIESSSETNEPDKASTTLRSETNSVVNDHKPSSNELTTKKTLSRIDNSALTDSSPQILSSASDQVSVSVVSSPSNLQNPENRKKGGIGIKKPKKKTKDNGMSSLIYIPLMIQAQLIPMMLIKLKFLALKAMTIGKLALIILGLNLLRNAMIGYNNDAEQYEHESLASQHYGYTGSPEYGSWVNRRMYTPPSDEKADRMSYTPYRKNISNSPFRRSVILQGNGHVGANRPRSSLLQQSNQHHPYRAYMNKFHQSSTSPQ